MSVLNSIEDCPPLPDIGIEIRHCPGFVGYAVGEDGSLWSCRARWKIKSWTQLNPSSDTYGYRQAQFGPARSRVNQRVSKLVCEAFHGRCPVGMELCHSDGNPQNDAASNLRWGTHSGNMYDRSVHGRGREMRGQNNGRAKLCDFDIRRIRQLAGSVTQHQLADQFGVALITINRIVRGVAWSHIQ